MAKTAKPKKSKVKDGRRVRLKRNSYAMDLKNTVIAWKTIDKLKNSEIQKKVKEVFGMDVSSSTLATWWNPVNLAK